MQEREVEPDGFSPHRELTSNPLALGDRTPDL